METEVRVWLEAYFGEQAARIDPADIFGSLQLEGDDGDELLLAFADRFGVDMQGLDTGFHYDANEPPGFLRAWTPVDPAGYVLPYIPIGISDLAAAAESRQWTMSYDGLKLGRRTVARSILSHLPYLGLVVFGTLLFVWLTPF